MSQYHFKQCLYILDGRVFNTDSNSQVRQMRNHNFKMVTNGIIASFESVFNMNSNPQVRQACFGVESTMAYHAKVDAATSKCFAKFRAPQISSDAGVQVNIRTSEKENII